MFKKLFLMSVLGALFQDVLSSAAGTKLVGGHLTVLPSGDHTASCEIDINDSYKYKVTIERIQSSSPVLPITSMPGSDIPADKPTV